MPQGFNTFTYLGHDHYECKFCSECFCGEDVVWAYHRCDKWIDELYLCNHCNVILMVHELPEHSRKSLEDKSICECEYLPLIPFTNQEILDAIEDARNYKCQDCNDCPLYEKCWVKYVKDAHNYNKFEESLSEYYKCVWETIEDLVKARQEKGINITEPIQETRQENDG